MELLSSIDIRVTFTQVVLLGVGAVEFEGFRGDGDNGDDDDKGEAGDCLEWNGGRVDGDSEVGEEIICQLYLIIIYN